MTITKTTPNGFEILEVSPSIVAEIRAEQAVNNSLEAKKERLKNRLEQECVRRLTAVSEHVARKEVVAMRAARATVAPVFNAAGIQSAMSVYIKDCIENEANHILAIDLLLDAAVDTYDVTTGWPV